MMETQLKNDKGLIGRTYAWVDERLKIAPLVNYMSDKRVPVHGHTIFYYFGGVSLLFFIIQVLTGILLLLYYRPGSDSAYESVKFIITEVNFGWLIRSMHSWSANLMIFSAVVHMFTVYFTHAYRKPREITWLTGIALLGLAMAFGFSGYLLPWNQLAFFATRVGTGMAGAIPIIGPDLLRIMTGGDGVTGATIGRFFGLHVAVLPGLFTVLLAAHLFMVQRQGMSEPLEWSGKPESEKPTMRFFPNFMMRDLLLWLVVINVLVILSVYFPDGIGKVHWPLGIKADPFGAPPASIKPEWYFMFAFQALKFLPAHVFFIEGELLGMIVMGIGGLVWALLPIFAGTFKEGRKPTKVVIFGWVVLGFIILMTALGYILD